MSIVKMHIWALFVSCVTLPTIFCDDFKEFLLASHFYVSEWNLIALQNVRNCKVWLVNSYPVLLSGIFNNYQI